MVTYKNESEVVALLRKELSKYSDFSIVQEEPVQLRDKTMRLDIVVKYGGIPVACVEVKTKENDNNLRNHLKAIFDYTGMYFCFAVVNETYKYYNPSSGNLVDKNEDEILTMLLDSVKDNAISCNELKDSFLKLVSTKPQWEKYGQIFSEFIDKAELKRCGSNVFFDDIHEKEFFRELLLTEANGKMPEVLCRYTSAKSFYLSLKNEFRISSVEVMNDEFETKAIDDYSNLKIVKTELLDYLYNGFILAFSKIERKDKLLQWYMYGDQAKGVCFTIEPKNDKDVFWAPVVYVPKKPETHDQTLLNFLNELLGVKIDNQYSFKLRYWHYWKYFFKYDFYQEEEEVRMLIIQKDKGSTDWSQEFRTPYHYISRKREDMPFVIKSVMFGPRHHNTDIFQNYISEGLGNSIEISHSVIIGYR